MKRVTACAQHWPPTAGGSRRDLAAHRRDGPLPPDPASTARRALRQAAHALVMLGDTSRGIAWALAELDAPHSMSAEMGALSALVQVECPEREAALERFHAAMRMSTC